MTDEDLLLNLPDLTFGSGVVGVCDVCKKRQAVIVLQKERYQLCVLDFLNKTWVKSDAKPGRPLPTYTSERIWYPTDAVPSGKAPAIALTPTKVVKHPVVLIAPDVYGLTTSLLDAGIRLAREGFEVLLPDVGKTPGVGPADHLALRIGARFRGGIAAESARVQRLVGLYRDAMRALRVRPMVDPAKAAIFGASYGGSLAVVFAGTVHDLTAVALAYPIPISPAEFPRLVSAPTLLVSAGRDSFSRRSRIQFARIEAGNGSSVEFADFPTGRHDFLARDLRSYDLRTAEAAWDRIVGFLKSRLLPPPPRPPTLPRPAATVPGPVPPKTPTSPSSPPPDSATNLTALPTTPASSSLSSA